MNKPEMGNQHWSMDRKQLFQGISLKCAQPSEKRKGSQKRGPLIVVKIEKMFQVPGMTAALEFIGSPIIKPKSNDPTKLLHAREKHVLYAWVWLTVLESQNLTQWTVLSHEQQQEVSCMFSLVKTFSLKVC